MVAATSCLRCGRALGKAGVCAHCLLEAELPPAKLGDALILEDEIGHGGMGAVFRATHTRLGRTVAVKLLPEAQAQDPEARARFEREARALAQLSHPHIVQVHDFGEAEGQRYLVMEYVQGRPLSDCLPLPAAEAVRVAIEICDALAHAHAQGVIHRDVKPANVFLDAQGHAKLGDFGIARFSGEERAGFTVTHADRAMGTPAYLAPEVLRGAQPDPRADIYAVGVLLHQMLTGALPGAELAPMPGGVGRVVRRALSSLPQDRFPSAEAMRDALSALRLGERHDDLPADELFFLRGAALLCTAAAAIGIWAALTSLTPRVLPASAIEPLTHSISEQLPDGRVVSRVRFEVGPVLGALVAQALAFLGLGVLRRHWRLAGLDTPQPMQPLRETKTLLVMGLVGICAYGMRMGLHTSLAAWLAVFPPLLGGLFEVAALFVFFTGLLQAWRTARPLSREPALFAGAILILVPPVSEFIRFLQRWRP